MKRRPKCEIDSSTPGVLTYREGYKEYCFPFFEQDGETVFVASPSFQRLFLFFVTGDWHFVPTQLAPADRDRITERIVDHLRQNGARVRVMSRESTEPDYCGFHPELLECHRKAAELLEAAGLCYFADYSSIDILDDEYGLEVCGIRDESNMKVIARVLGLAFPHWHFGHSYHEDSGGEPGWSFAIHMFSCCCPDDGCSESDAL
jgi:hypothetical protein